MKKLFLISLILIAVLTLNACTNKQSANQESYKSQLTLPPTTAQPQDKQVEVASPSALGLANPASVNCEEKGGQLEMKENPNGTYGICVFDDNRQCEEWALFRNECPDGGVKITGYDNDQQIYCAITGGQVDMEKDECTNIDGDTCSLEVYFETKCKKY